MSMGNTLVNGTGNVVADGRDMVGGTGYAVKTGKTLVNGTGFQIGKSGVEIGTLDIGGIVKMNVNGSARNFIVVHQGLPSSMYDDSCNGTWLLMEDVYTDRSWHSSDINKYRVSAIHTYLNDTFLGSFDADIRSAIKQVKIPYASGSAYSVVVSGANGLSAKIFLLSGYEVGWTQSASKYFPIDGACLSYFTGTAFTNAKRIGKLDGSATWWWLRSPSINGSAMSWCVISDGGCNHTTCTNRLGVRPALILPQETLIDADGNVLG